MNLIMQAREILNTAEKENRNLTAEEEQKYDRIMEDVDKLAKDIERLERMEQLEKELRTSAQPPIKPIIEGRNDGANAEYRDVFMKMLRQTIHALDPHELRALKVGDAGKGGYIVPTDFEKRLVQALAEENVMRRLATIIPTSSDTKIPVESDLGSATWVAEEGAYQESDAEFNQAVISAYKLTTLIKVSEELLDDSAFDLESYIINAFARRFGVAEEAAFVSGDGNNKPTGIINTAQVGVTTAANNAITFDEIIDLYYSLKTPYRNRAAFIMNDTTAKVIRKLKDNDGQYLWQPSVQQGQPDMLLGRPVYTTSAMPTIAANAKVITFGDFSYYWIADRQGRVIQRLNELYAANGQVGFRGYERVDGKLILPEAVKVLQMNA
ncbi:phage major capsid protein [Caloramator sp. Dgby_cultured_2]|uniref:phage major capsid protein n=1 Tax=Caloramator sp. Dgby_cultured_2 TaxID=3029174 RepID=UPI00237E8CDC|nr:phage major capsid protein [Caloramator sp. Dgby_cultured_2]WDU84214.1 phage major capsid protein [Caloramator sp. Dgby_cultured_2]